MSVTADANIKLRPAAKADRKVIRQLVRSEQLNPFGLKWERFIVAELSDQIVGCAQIKTHRGGAREFASLVVRPEWRGHGIAARLINHFLQSSREPLWLMCGNQLIPFYEQFNFHLVLEPGKMPGYLSRIYRLGKLFSSSNRFLAIMCHQQPTKVLESGP